MKNKIVFDTSFLSSAFLVNDVHSSKAQEILSNISVDTKLIVPVITRFELLMYNNKIAGNGFKLVDTLLREKMHVEIRYIDEKFTKEFISFYEQNEFKIKATDATILFTAIQENAELLTFDRQMKKLYKKMLKS